MTAPLLVRLEARDRELMLWGAIGPSAPRRSRLAWTAITHLGGTGTNVVAAAAPWFRCCDVHAASRVALTSLVTSHLISVFPALAAPLLLLALLVGFSRVRLGVHFPGDVLAGQAIASATAALVFAAS